MATPLSEAPHDLRLRNVVLAVGLANLAYFVVEFVIARRIGSVSLFADSVDFLEDAIVNLLIVAALGWTLRSRARLGIALSVILFVPAFALVWTAWQKLSAMTAPEPALLSATGLGALAVNLACAFGLATFRHRTDSLTRAAFLSAKNDALANIAIIVAGLVTLAWRSGWPDLIVGVGIAILNVDAARAAWRAARDEQATAASATP